VNSSATSGIEGSRTSQASMPPGLMTRSICIAWAAGIASATDATRAKTTACSGRRRNESMR
jgi:hypothetical protein